MAGVVEVIATAPIGKIIDDLELLITCSQPEDYEGQVIFIPFSWSHDTDDRASPFAIHNRELFFLLLHNQIP